MPSGLLSGGPLIWGALPSFGARVEMPGFQGGSREGRGRRPTHRSEAALEHFHLGFPGSFWVRGGQDLDHAPCPAACGGQDLQFGGGGWDSDGARGFGGMAGSAWGPGIPEGEGDRIRRGPVVSPSPPRQSASFAAVGEGGVVIALRGRVALGGTAGQLSPIRPGQPGGEGTSAARQRRQVRRGQGLALPEPKGPSSSSCPCGDRDGAPPPMGAGRGPPHPTGEQKKGNATNFLKKAPRQNAGEIQVGFWLQRKILHGGGGG